MLLATKLLRRLHMSEHLQVRYRTARMLEIWDMAASSMPSSPVVLRVLVQAAFTVLCTFAQFRDTNMGMSLWL